jgi:hypothetical protein
MKSLQVFFALFVTLLPAQLCWGQGSQSLQETERKLQHIESNGKLPKPEPTPTTFTEREINAYLASGSVQLPAGVQSARFEGQPGIITATTRVDFDRIKAGVNSSNPLLSVFTGVHDVVVVAHAHGEGHQGFVQVDSVSLDGIQIPRFALQLFVEKYLRPKYPQVGLNSQFALPDKVDTALVGSHILTLEQR